MSRPFTSEGHAKVLNAYGCVTKKVQGKNIDALLSIAPPLLHRIGSIPIVKTLARKVYPIGTVEITTHPINQANITEVCAELMQLTKKIRRLNVTVVDQNEIDHELIHFFEKQGFKKKEWATFIIDTSQDLDDLFQKIDKATRKIIRRTKEKGVSVRAISTEADLRKYYFLLRKERKSLGFYTVPYRLVKAQWDAMYPQFYQVFVAEKEGKLLAGMGVVIQDNCMIEVASALSKKAREKKIYANDALKWAIIEWAHKNGIKYYDLAGVHPNPLPGSKEERIRKFKEKWGGVLVPQYTFSKKN